MSHPPRPTLPMRNGVSASCVAVPSGSWATVLDFLSDRLPALGRTDWQARLDRGEVLNAQGEPVSAQAPCPTGQRLFYYRSWPDEPAAPEEASVLFQDDWLVVADKPHFMPVTPSGRFVQRSLLVQLKRRLGLPHLSPLHRIDRETAGLVVLAVQPGTRAAYQALFRDRQVDKLYEAVAPHAPNLPLPCTHQSRLEADPDRFFLSREVAGTPNSESLIALNRVLASGHHALYHLRPISGQRHQLRLHMAALGVPILGDSFYPQVLRPAEAPDDATRPLQLLARSLRFSDPVTGQLRQFESQRLLAAATGAWPD